MFWDNDVPRHRPTTGVEVTLVAGALEGAQPPAPPPDSWAANPDADLPIWLITLDAGASWTLPRAHSARTARTLYFFSGPKLDSAWLTLGHHAAIEVVSDQAV